MACVFYFVNYKLHKKRDLHYTTTLHHTSLHHYIIAPLHHYITTLIIIFYYFFINQLHHYRLQKERDLKMEEIRKLEETVKAMEAEQARQRQREIERKALGVTSGKRGFGTETGAEGDMEELVGDDSVGDDGSGSYNSNNNGYSSSSSSSSSSGGSGGESTNGTDGTDKGKGSTSTSEGEGHTPPATEDDILKQSEDEWKEAEVLCREETSVLFDTTAEHAVVQQIFATRPAKTGSTSDTSNGGTRGKGSKGGKDGGEESEDGTAKMADIFVGLLQTRMFARAGQGRGSNSAFARFAGADHTKGMNFSAGGGMGGGATGGRGAGAGGAKKKTK